MTKRLKHLLLATLEDPYDVRSWSGIPFNMRLALENKVDRLTVISRLKPKRTPVNVALRVALGARRWPLYLTAAAQAQFAKETLHAIDTFRPDAMLTISSHCMVGMDDPPPIPSFMFTDAPWIAWKETYREFESLPLLGKRFARLEAKAAERYTGLIFSSDWAMREALRLYGAPASKLYSFPMGAGWVPDLDRRQIIAHIENRPSDRLDLLYVGKDWTRKGGPLAVEVATTLKAVGVPNVCLHVVGCEPEIPLEAREVVRVHGFLSAKDVKQSETLKNLFLKSHFMIVPTQAECFGLIFAEAQAFGLPTISRRVQAVPSIVLDDETGILESADAPAQRYVERILGVIQDRQRYKQIAIAARDRFEKLLNWEKFAENVVEAITRNLY